MRVGSTNAGRKVAPDIVATTISVAMDQQKSQNGYENHSSEAHMLFHQVTKAKAFADDGNGGICKFIELNSSAHWVLTSF